MCMYACAASVPVRRAVSKACDILRCISALLSNRHCHFEVGAQPGFLCPAPLPAAWVLPLSATVTCTTLRQIRQKSPPLHSPRHFCTRKSQWNKLHVFRLVAAAAIHDGMDLHIIIRRGYKKSSSASRTLAWQLPTLTPRQPEIQYRIAIISIMGVRTSAASNILH